MKMEEWKEYKLGDIYEVHNGLSKGGKFFGSGYQFLSFSTIFNNWFIPNELSNLVQSTDKEQESYSIKEGDVFITRTSETADELGMSCVALKDYPKATYNGFCKRMRQYNHDIEVHSKYIGYYLRNPNFRLHFQAFSGSMSTRASLTNEALLGLTVKLPPLPTQQKIATILSSLDDKIELNNKINTNLEQQAQALFNQFFIKNSCKVKFDIKELGEVTVNLRDKIIDKDTPVLSAVNTGHLQRSEEYFSKQVYSKDISKYILVKAGDFAYNPARINIGSIGINDFDYDGCVSPVYVAFSVDKDYRSFFKYYFKSNNLKEETKLRASGSVRQTLNYGDFAKIQIKYPPRDVAKKFEEFHTNIEQSKRKIIRENEVLISIRDTLLPKLMNGDIEVNKVEL